MGLLRAIYQDYRRYQASDDGPGFVIVFLTQGFWASCVYRVSRAILSKIRLRWLRLPARVLLLCAQKVIEILTGISLPPECEIGDGLYIGHFGGLIVSGQARLGNHCNLSQGVTIGVAGRGDRRGCPVLGNRVYVGAGAILIGNIQIGDDAAIGAGAVVTKSVPPRAVVAGNPARILSYEGSFAFVRYDGMETDPERLAALAETPVALNDLTAKEANLAALAKH
jgi:serine O-acetyltransferase